MAMNVRLDTGRLSLSEDQERRVRHQLAMLDRRLTHFPAPTAHITLRVYPPQRRVTVDLRVALGPLAGHLISHQAAATVDHAVRLAVEDAERQLERRLADQRGEPAFGVPSRRLPKALRAHPSEPGGTAQ